MPPGYIFTNRFHQAFKVLNYENTTDIDFPGLRNEGFHIGRNFSPVLRPEMNCSFIELTEIRAGAILTNFEEFNEIARIRISNE